MKCARAGCPRTATQTPVLTFTAKRQPRGPRVEATLQLHVCSEHAHPDPKLFVTDAGWAQIAGRLKQQGLAAPDRDSLKVLFKPLQ